MQKNNRKKVAIAAGLVLAIVGAGAAYAYWTAGGSGSGSASTGTNAGITVNQTSTISNMRPGDSAQTLSGDFTNTNDSPVYVTSVVASIDTVTQASGAVGSCSADDYTLANATMPVGAQVPTGTNVGSWTGATIKFNNSATVNQDGCKGATVTIAYNVVD